MTDLATINESVQRLSEELYASYETNQILEESLADVQLAAEDAGWQRLGVEIRQALTRAGLAKIVTNCRTMAIASPLIKRGLALRGAYVWGQGVEISGRDQAVNDLVQDFVEDNLRSFTGSQAREDLERALGTDGNVFLALFTSPITGRVQVRSTPFDEVIDVINNPGDRDEPWLYLREYEVTVIEAGTTGVDGAVAATRSRWERRREYHPAVGWSPTVRPKNVNGVPINWAAPILHIAVNRLDGQTWGIPDALASLPWARAYEGFITDWARLMKSLSRFAWRLSGDKSSKAQRAAAKVRSAVGDLSVPASQLPGSGSPAGQMTASGPGMNLEAIPKSGATLDSESGRPLAALTAAGLGLPVTTLLADPGVTGARATAETLDKPTVLEMSMRRELWQWAMKTVLGYAVEQSVKAPAGMLSGSVTRDLDDRVRVQLADNGDATIEFDWPKLDSLDPKTLVDAIVGADSTDKLPPPVTMKLLLAALGVKDADDIVEDHTDEDGNWIDPTAGGVQAAVAAHRAGVDDPTAMDSE